MNRFFFLVFILLLVINLRASRIVNGIILLLRLITSNDVDLDSWLVADLDGGSRGDCASEGDVFHL